MSNRDFGLVRSFDIDDGQLDGMTPQQCFTLGYELSMVDEQLKTGQPFERMIHAENCQRIESECIKDKRSFEVTWMAGDVSESWMTLKVEAGSCLQNG